MSIDLDWVKDNIIKRELTDEESSALGCIEVVEHNAWENILEKGKPGGNLYFLRSGTASVQIDDNGSLLKLDKVTEGALFGEMSFLNDNVISANIVAKEPCVVYKLPRESFSELMMQHQALAYSFFELIVNHQVDVMTKARGQLLPVLKDLRDKANSLPLIVKLIPVILIITYIGAWGYQWKTQEGIHNYQQEMQIQKSLETRPK